MYHRVKLQDHSTIGLRSARLHGTAVTVLPVQEWRATSELPTCQHSCTDSDQEDDEPAGASVPGPTEAPPPAQSPVLVDPLMSQAIPVPVSDPVDGVEVVIVPEVGGHST